MKKFYLLSIVLLLTLFSSCGLFEHIGGKIYFYGELAGADNDDSNRDLQAKAEGYTLIMSRGKEGQTLTKAEAEALVEFTKFTLQLDGASLDPLGSMEVDELGNSGYHVVQEFDTGPLEEGDYILIGTTEFKDLAGARINRVFLNVEWSFWDTFL
jgi:hypothetical protein